MAAVEVTGVGNRGWFGHLVRRWWPLPSFVGCAVVAQEVLLTSRYDVGGHAAGHLASASAPFMAAAVLATLFWATPTARRQPDVVFAAAAWFATTLLVLVGNVRVVKDLVAAGYSHTPTSAVPDVADHGLANAAVWYAVAAAVLVVASFRRRKHIGTLGMTGAIAAMVFPPWIIPGAGVVVLTVLRCVARARAERTPPGATRHHGARMTL